MEYVKARTDDQPIKDVYFDGDYVYKLTQCNYHPFIRSKLLTMVMFYNMDDIEQRHVFSKAAAETRKKQHAYAGVNCSLEPTLCNIEGVIKTPIYKLYDKRTISTILPRVKDHTVLKDLVEKGNKDES